MDFLNRIENQLDMPVGEKADVMRELTAHFDELYEEFVASGMGPAKAQEAAAERMGSPLNIAARLNAAHNTASWRSALLCIVPFAASAVYLAASALGLPSGVLLSLLVAIGAVMLVASARELLCGRRPLWLATWLAAGLVCVPGVLYADSGSTTGLAGLRAAAYAVLVVTAIVVTVSVVTHRLLKAVLIMGTIAACSALILATTVGEQASPLVAAAGFASFAMVIASWALVVFFAKIVFQAHTYGSAIQAVLFLLGAFAIRLFPIDPGSAAWGQALGVCLSALAVIWFARAPRRGTKAWACYSALFVHALAGQSAVTILPSLPSFLSAFLSAAVSAGIYYIIVASPILRIVREDVNRLTAAR